MAETAFVKIGGDAKGAQDAFAGVQNGLRALQAQSEKAARGIKSAFGGIGNVFGGVSRAIGGVFNGMKQLGGFILDRLVGIFHKLKWAVLGFVGASAAALVAYNKDAAAQARLNTLLQANVRNWRAARGEIDAMIRTVQRRTNFSDDDVRGIFGALIQTTGQRGFGIGQALTPSILNLSAARGMNPEALAEAIGRAIGTGQTMMLRRQGILVDPRGFKRDPVGAIQSAIGSIAPGGAAAERGANPLPALINSLGEVMESFGGIVSRAVNPAIERLARWADHFADRLGKMSGADLWAEVKRYAADAWDFTKKLAANAFYEIRTGLMDRLFPKPVQPTRVPSFVRDALAGNDPAKAGPSMTKAQVLDYQAAMTGVGGAGAYLPGSGALIAQKTLAARADKSVKGLFAGTVFDRWRNQLSGLVSGTASQSGAGGVPYPDVYDKIKGAATSLIAPAPAQPPPPDPSFGMALLMSVQKMTSNQLAQVTSSISNSKRRGDMTAY